MKLMSVSVISTKELVPLYISTRIISIDIERANMMTEVTDRRTECKRRILRVDLLKAARPTPRIRGTKTNTRATIGKANIVLVNPGLRGNDDIVFDSMTISIMIIMVIAASMAPITILPRSYVRHIKH